MKTTIYDEILIFYLAFALLLELLDLIVQITPTRKDDEIIFKAKSAWRAGKNSIFILSFRTPLNLLAFIVFYAMSAILGIVKYYLLKLKSRRKI